MKRLPTPPIRGLARPTSGGVRSASIVRYNSQNHVGIALARPASAIELRQHVMWQPDEPIAIQGALVLEAAVAGKRRGDSVKRDRRDLNTNHIGDMGAPLGGRHYPVIAAN